MPPFGHAANKGVHCGVHDGAFALDSISSAPGGVHGGGERTNRASRYLADATRRAGADIPVVRVSPPGAVVRCAGCVVRPGGGVCPVSGPTSSGTVPSVGAPSVVGHAALALRARKQWSPTLSGARSATRACRGPFLRLPRAWPGTRTPHNRARTRPHSAKPLSTLLSPLGVGMPKQGGVLASRQQPRPGGVRARQSTPRHATQRTWLPPQQFRSKRARPHRGKRQQRLPRHSTVQGGAGLGRPPTNLTKNYFLENVGVVRAPHSSPPRRGRHPHTAPKPRPRIAAPPGYVQPPTARAMARVFCSARRRAAVCPCDREASCWWFPDEAPARPVFNS